MTQTHAEQYFKQLDGLRFVAVLLIMAVHWLKISSIYQYTTIASNVSVDMYFVLSGFLITRILLYQKIKIESQKKTLGQSLKNFYARRSLRIFPIYYLLLFLCLLLNIEPIRKIYPWLMTYTTNFLHLKINNFGPFAHLWTLSIEEQFYLFFPIFILFIPKKFLQSFLLLGVVSAVAARAVVLLIFENSTAVYVIPFCCADALCLGGLMAHSLVYQNNLERVLEKKYWLILSILVFLICCYRFIYVNQTDTWAFIWFRLSISGMCVWLIGTGVLNRYQGFPKYFLEHKSVMYLGKICYGIYLFHFMAPFLTAYFLELFPILKISSRYLVLEKAFINFIFSVTLASLSWELIEQPINRYKKVFV